MDGRARQQEIYLGGVSGARPRVSTDSTADIDLTLGLYGCSSPAALSPDLLTSG